MKLPMLKRNWLAGIKTPWTISNEQVWKKTHDLGGRLFKISGLIGLLGLLIQEYAFSFMVGPILISTIYLVLYSYLEYKKQN